VTVSGVTLTAVNDAPSVPNVTDNGILTLTRDTITGNILSGGIKVVTTTAEGSDLVLKSSTVSGNFTLSDGGGIEALAGSGGPTDTLALLAGSPAIAAGNAATCAQPPVSNAD
jgi:hypothetical protein